MLNEKLISMSKKGVTIGAIMTVIIAAIGMSIGIWVMAISFGAVDQTGWSTAANDSFMNVQNTSWAAMKLLAVGLIVLAFGVIIAGFYFKRD